MRIKTDCSRLLAAFLAFGMCVQVFGDDPEVTAGGALLAIPPPSNDFVEAGEKLRTAFFELLVPSTNRLLNAYVPAQSGAELNGGKMAGGLDVYALLEISRRAEYTDCMPQAFEQVLKGLEPAMGKFDAEKRGQLEQEMNIRLQSLGTKPIEIGHPEMLGGIFKKTDASGFAMVLAVKQGDRSSTMACGFGVLRVKQRLIFAYLYRKYESPKTVSLVRENLEAWSDAILSKNK
jgi:hypothetical protein